MSDPCQLFCPWGNQFLRCIFPTPLIGPEILLAKDICTYRWVTHTDCCTRKSVSMLLIIKCFLAINPPCETKAYLFDSVPRFVPVHLSVYCIVYGLLLKLRGEGSRTSWK